MGVEASTPLIPPSIILSGNKDSSTGPVPRDCGVPIAESRVSSGWSSPFQSQLSLGPFINAPATSRTNVGSRLSLRPPRWPGVGRVGIFANRSVTGCVPALGGRLPCPGVGVVGVSTNRSVTGCVPALGDGLPCPWVGKVGYSTNRSVTGCIPALGGGLPSPGVSMVGVSTNWSVTGCIPALGGWWSTIPRGWRSRRFQEPDGYRLCSGPRRQSIMPQGWHGRRFHEPVGYQLYSCLRRRTAMSRGWHGRRFHHTIFPIGLFSINLPICGPPPLPRKENPRSWAPNCSGDGGGGGDKQHTFVFITFII